MTDNQQGKEEQGTSNVLPFLTFLACLALYALGERLDTVGFDVAAARAVLAPALLPPEEYAVSGMSFWLFAPVVVMWWLFSFLRNRVVALVSFWLSVAWYAFVVLGIVGVAIWPETVPASAWLKERVPEAESFAQKAVQEEGVVGAARAELQELYAPFTHIQWMQESLLLLVAAVAGFLLLGMWGHIDDMEWDEKEDKAGDE